MSKPDFYEMPLEYGPHKVLAPAILTIHSRGIWLEIIPGSLADTPEGPSISSRGSKKPCTSLYHFVDIWHAERAAADLQGDRRPVVGVYNKREYKNGTKVDGAYILRGVEGVNYFIKNDQHPRSANSKCHRTHVIVRQARR